MPVRVNRQRGGPRIKAALAQLDLSPAQRKQIEQIVTDAKVERATARAGATKGHAAGKELLQKILAVLTQPQKAKLKQLMQAGRLAKA